MPIDPLIARGYPGGVADAYQQGQSHRMRMDEFAAMGQRRNALADMERQQAQQAQGAAASEQALMERFAEMEQYAQAPAEVKAQYVAQQAQQHPEFAQTPFAQMPPEQAFDGMRRGLAARLGVKLPEPVAPLAVQDLGGARVITQGGQYKGQVPRERIAAGGGGGGQRGGFDEYAAMSDEQRALYDQYKGRKPTAAPSSLQTDGNGVVYDLSKATDGERTAVGYYDRIVSARQAIEAPGMANYVPSMGSFMAFASLLDDDTGVIGATAANGILNDNDREYMGQALDLILAKMRKESGATIKGGEFRKEYINLFPMPNDPPKVLADKKIKRQLAENQLRKAAGRAAGPLATADAPTAPPSPQMAAPPVDRLKEGVHTTFANKQVWTLQNGKPVQVK